MTQVLANTPKGFETSRYPVTRLYSVASSLVRKIGPGDLDDREVLHYSIPNVQEYGTGMVEDGGEIESDKWVLEDECVLISKLNPRKTTVCLAVPSSSLLTVASTEFIPLATGSTTDNRFLNYLLQTPIVTDHLTARTESATRSHQRVNPRLVTSLVAPWPDSHIRQRVVDYLDREILEINTLVEDQNLLKGLLQEKKTSLITRAIASTKGSSEVFPPLDSLADVLVSTVDKKVYPGEVPQLLCNYTDVYYGDRISTSAGFMKATASPEQIQKFSLRSGDIAITKDSETSDDIGRPALIVADIPRTVYGYHLAIYRPHDRRYSNYIRYFFESAETRAELARRTPGVTRVGLSKETLRNLRIPVPEPREAESIAAQLDKELEQIDKAVSDAEHLTELLQERRSALISAAVTGKIDVTVQGVSAVKQLRDELEVHV